MEIKHLLRHPIAFHRIFVDLVGDISYAVIFSQLYYWSEVYGGDEFWITNESLAEQTGASVSLIKRAKKVFIEKGYIKTEVKEVSHFRRVTFYRLDYEKISEDIQKLKLEEPKRVEVGSGKDIEAEVQNEPNGWLKVTSREGQNEPLERVKLDHSSGSEWTDKEITNKEITIKKNTNIGSTSKKEIFEIIEKWNNFAEGYGLPRIRAVTEKRRKHILARLKEEEFDFDLILEKIKGSDFLLGRKKEWRVDFDFIISSRNNYIKILEGKYDNIKVFSGRYNDFDSSIQYLEEVLNGRDN